MKRVYAISVLVIIVLLNLLLISCDTTDPNNYNDYHNKILFTSSRSGKPQLYVMNPDGSGIRQITSGNYWHTDGRWSPDAKQIVCNTLENSSTAGLEMVVMNVDGSNRKLLGYGNQMSWHPNGGKIIYENCPSCEIGIFEAALYIIDSNGQNRIKLPIEGGYPDWSPDGNNILISVPHYEDSKLSAQLTIVDYPNFSNAKPVGPVNAGYAVWSPNGTEIAYAYTDSLYTVNGTPLSNIYLMDSDGSNLKKISNHSTTEHYFLPRWSPDGQKIIFLAQTVDGSEKSYLYIVNKDGTNLHKVIGDSSIKSCDWSK